MTLRHLATLATVTLAASAPAARAQVVFSQNFNAATQNSDVTGTGPNQFTGILGGVFNVSNGALTGTKTSAVSSAINRTTALSSLAGGAATFQFDFTASNFPTANSNTNDLIFQVGNAYTNVTGAETGTYAQFNIDLQTTGYQVAGLSAILTGTHTFSFDLNNTGATVNFTTPGGGTLALMNDNFALFVDNTNIIPGGQIGVAAANGLATADITQFKLRYPSTADNATITVDNFVVTQVVPEPSSIAFAGLGLAGLALGTTRRSRRATTTIRV